jgi:ATP-binding cassette subfamily F protein 3
LLKAVSLSLAYDGEPLFSGADLLIGAGDRIGLLGPNGVGKTSLLRVLAGELPPTSGQVIRGPGTRIGYVAQSVPDPDGTVGAFLDEGLGEVARLSRTMHVLEQKLTDGADVLAEYGDVQERWTGLQGWTAGTRLAEIRQARLLLARALLDAPDVLLLDEPTNHLDAEGAAWLGDWLAGYPGGVLTVSHDRAFLDRTVSRVIELDGIHEAPQDYPGCGYTAYRAEKARRWQRLLLDYEAQEKDRTRWEADIARTKEQARGVETTALSGLGVDQLRRYAKKVAKKAKARERRLRRQMDSVRWIAEPQTRPPLALAFPSDVDSAGSTVLVASGLTVVRGGRTLLSTVDLTVAAGDRILITGRNGAGKTTLLRALAGLGSPDEGEVKTNTEIAVLPQTVDGLRTGETVIQHFRRHVPVYIDDAERLLTGYLFGSDQWAAPLRTLSAGELRRLLLAVLVNSPARVLLLDEPTNFLDLDALDVVEEALRAFRGTLLTVTHDRYFADSIVHTRHWHVQDGTVADKRRLADPAQVPAHES